jgi:hypothetical protein
MADPYEPEPLDFGESPGAMSPRLTALPAGGLDWGDGTASVPQAISVTIGRQFEGAGDATVLSRMYERTTLFQLLGHVVLALVSLALTALAAAVVILAPSERTGLVPWIAAPAAIVAFGLGGFALVRLSASPAGLTMTGEAPGGNRKA